LETYPEPVDCLRAVLALVMRAAAWLQLEVWRVRHSVPRLIERTWLGPCHSSGKDSDPVQIMPISLPMPAWRAGPLVLQLVRQICPPQLCSQVSRMDHPLRMPQLQELEASVDNPRGLPLILRRLQVTAFWLVSQLARRMAMFRLPTLRSSSRTQRALHMRLERSQLQARWVHGLWGVASLLQMDPQPATWLGSAGRSAMRKASSWVPAAWRAGRLAHLMNMPILMEAHRMISMVSLMVHRSHLLLSLPVGSLRVDL